MSLRNAMILAINTAILAVLFVFSAWLYSSSRREVGRQVSSGMDRAAAITSRLAGLRERELSSLAQSIAVSPVLRGALATGDKETIRDVLQTMAEKNGLDEAALLRDGAVAYEAGAAGGEAAFQGSAPVAFGEDLMTLRVAQVPTPALLQAWSGISGVRYAVRKPASLAGVHDLPGEDAELGAKPLPADRVSVVSASGKYYARESALPGGRIALGLFDPYAPYWDGFESMRNSLIVLGCGLFFLGLLLSVGFASLVERYVSSGSSRPDEAWRDLVEEIERAKARAG